MKVDLLQIRTLIAKINNDPEIDVVLSSLLFSSLVYFSDEFIEKTMLGLGITEAEYKIVEVPDGFKFMVIEFGDNTYVAFRGTLFKMWNNTKRVMNFFPKKGRDGVKLHRGFAMAFEDCNEELQHLLAGDKPVIFTGHSLGGALALIASNHYNGSAVTFASPNVFFNEKMDGKIHHVGYRIKGDPVPHLPMTTFFLVWSRAKFEFMLKSDKFYINQFEYHSLGMYIKHLMERYEPLQGKKRQPLVNF